LGEERYAQTYQARSVFDSGAVVSFSSDEWWGGEMLATYISPWLGMQVGHTRQYPREWWESEDDGVRGPIEERLSLEQLVEGYTRNGAYQLRREYDLGSIEVGKLADLLVLDENLFEIDPYEIWNTRPSAVIVEGKVVQGALPD
jgi:predicted amidohydrolase YtcJ